MKPVIIIAIIGVAGGIAVVMASGLMMIEIPTEKIVSDDFDEPSISTTNTIQEKQESTLDSFSTSESIPSTSQDCLGSAQCITGTVSEIIEGDTIIVNEQSIRFALASAPSIKYYGGTESRDFIETICPVGSTVLVDEDDGKILDNIGQMIGLVYCNGIILNSELLDANLGHLELRFCDSSEFGDSNWAKKHGC